MPFNHKRVHLTFVDKEASYLKPLFIDTDFSEGLICMRSIPNVIIKLFRTVIRVCVCARVCVQEVCLSLPCVF